MYIKLIYKDTPELSNLRRKSSLSDLSVEKTLLVNPKCYIRVMLEYIRKTCRLGICHFDLCDATGCLRGLASQKSYDYATDFFENKMTYYVIVLVNNEGDMKRATVIPQLNWSNAMYDHLVARVKQFLLTGTAMSPAASSGKSTPPAPKKPAKKK